RGEVHAGPPVPPAQVRPPAHRAVLRRRRDFDADRTPLAVRHARTGKLPRSYRLPPPTPSMDSESGQPKRPVLSHLFGRSRKAPTPGYGLLSQWSWVRVPDGPPI